MFIKINMNMFGLEGSGFLLSVCLTLFLTGVIVFYVRQAICEQNTKLASMLSIVQGMTSFPSPKMNTNEIHEFGGGGGGDGVQGFVTSPHEFIDQQNVTKQPMETISENSQEDKIDVSDNDSENSYESDTTDDDDDDASDNESEGGNESDHGVNNDSIIVVDEGEEPTDIKEINIDTDNAVLLTDLNAGLNSPSVTEDESIEQNDNNLDEIGNLDEMLIGMIKTHEEQTTNNSNLSSLKVGELRQMIKDKNIKVNNLSKLKKDECIELLS